MPRRLLIIGLLALWSASFQNGCHDLQKSLTHLNYYPNRDMRRTIVIDPQRVSFRGPDSLAVPTIGRDLWNETMEKAPYDKAKLAMKDPYVSDAGSIVRGDTLYHRFCWTCHGMDMSGIGPVTDKYLPAANMLGDNARQQPDGYLYMYMRHGGAIMPSYGNAVSKRDAWDLIHYIRNMQKLTPPGMPMATGTTP